MMLYSEDRENGFRDLVKKYGIAYLIILINCKVAVYVFILLFVYIISLSPDRAVLSDTTTGIGYLLSMLLNDTAAYLLPLISFRILFGSGNEKKTSVPGFTGPGAYKRYPCETALLFISGNTLARAGGILTNVISMFLNDLFGIPETQLAFSGSMPMDLPQYITFNICIIIIAPVCEEILFRHLMLRPMRKYGDETAVLLTSLLFALMHFNFDQFLYTFISGFILGIIAVRSGSCIPCIICHILNNLIATMTVYMPETFGNKVIDDFFFSLQTVINAASNIILVISVPVIVLCLALKLFRFRDESGIPVGRKASIIIKEPFLIIPTVLMLTVTLLELLI